MASPGVLPALIGWRAVLSTQLATCLQQNLAVEKNRFTMSASGAAPALYEKLAENNCVCVVLSYGFRLAITGVLERAGLMKHVDAVVTPGLFQGFEDGEDMGDQKTSQLTYLAQVYGKGNPVDIILVDDTEPNVLTANAMGYKGVHVKGRGGIDDDDLSRIHQAMESLDFSKKCIVALDFDLTMCKTHLTSVFCYKYIQANGGILDTAGLMKVIPEEILVECVPQLMSFFTKESVSAPL
jgi:phosphoglycolate phosphatase-like HAD superfamily hydrolase